MGGFASVGVIVWRWDADVCRIVKGSFFHIGSQVAAIKNERVLEKVKKKYEIS